MDWRNRVRQAAVLVVLMLGLVLVLAPEAIAQFFPPGFNPGFNPGYREPSTGEQFTRRLLTLIIGGGLGFALGAFFSPMLKEFRRFVWMGLGALLVGFVLFGPAPIADILSGFGAFLIFLVALKFGLRLGAKLIKAAKKKRPTSYGSAKWATLEYLNKFGMIGRSGFMLGEFAEGESKNPLRYEGERHLLTVAPTRSGKGVSSIVPNLLNYEGSAFVIDPKGENAMITAYRRGPGIQGRIAGMKQSVFLIDPWNVAAGRLKMPRARFNPLDWINANDPDAAENAFLLADALVPVVGEGESRFWDEEAKALLTGLILYVATAPEESSRRHLGRVRDILVKGDEELKLTLGAMYKHPHAVVSTTATRTASKEPKLRSSVLASAQAHTHFLDSPRIRESLSQSDFRFEDLKTTGMSVYLILPADRLKTFDRWMRLLIQQAITVNARNVERKPAKPILFLLDEMATLGRLGSVEQAFGLMAGFGMQLWGIVQDLSQLARIYGEHSWQTFISNSGVIQYFGSRDKMTAEYFSALCGVTTIEVRNLSWAFNKVYGFVSGSGGSSSSNSSGTTETTSTSEAQRHLAYADELMVLKESQQIVFIENLDPIQAEKVKWYQHPELQKLGIDVNALEARAAAKQQTAQPAQAA